MGRNRGSLNSQNIIEERELPQNYLLNTQNQEEPEDKMDINEEKEQDNVKLINNFMKGDK